jgi:stage II sporulation protein D
MPEFSGNIRIGVVPTAASVTVGSDASWTLRNKRTGDVVFTGGTGGVTVTLESGSVSKTNWRLQITCTGLIANRDAAIALAASRGYPTYTEFFAPGGCWRVMIGEYPASMSLAERLAERARLANLGHAPANGAWHSITITTGVTQFRVTRGSDVVLTEDPVVLTAAQGALVRINSTLYRGIAEVTRNAAGSLAGVNELSLEQYLYGVVPRELGPVSWPQPEAQKAQAVAARTYALRGLGKRALDGYDLLATTTDQVYGGYSAEHPISSAAVDATAGFVATTKDAAGNDRLIEALFSSTTGGWTANNEEVFNSAPVSYLRSVPDAQRGQAIEHVPSLDVFRNHANPRSLRAERHGQAEADWARFHRWTFEWSNEEISEVLSAAFAAPGESVGAVQAINVLERGPSGRVMLIEFVTEAGTFTRSKDAIRGTLKYIDAGGNPQSLLSTLFFIEPVLDKKTHELAGFRVFGGGFGHGVGLGQTGAAGLAEKGATYQEILKHYYQGIDLTKAY